MAERLLRHVKSLVVLLAAAVLLSMVSVYLPANGDLAMAVGWIGLGGRGEVMSPIWGELVRWSFAHLPGSAAFRLGAVSAFGGILCVALLAFAVERFLLLAAHKAEAKATDGERTYWLPVRLGTLLAALALLFSPPFFLGATRTGPLTVRLAIPLAAFAVIGAMTAVKKGMVSAYLAVVVGFLAALGGFEGASGIVAFPFLLALCVRKFVRGTHHIATVAGLFLLGAVGGGAFAMGDALSVRHVILSLSALVRPLPGGLAFPCIVPLVAFVVLPTAVLATFIATRRLTTAGVRGICFGVWALAVVALAAVTCASHPVDHGRAANLYVERALARLGTAKWIVSDGTWDDLLLLKKPADVRLVSFRREHDPAHGQELLAWTKGAGDDLRFAAELGPTKFLSEWFAGDAGAATNCLFLTRTERGDGDVQLTPAVYGWRAAQGDERTVETLAGEWAAAWEEFAPLLGRKDEPAAGVLTRWFSVQGNSVGAMAAAGHKDDLAWKTCFRVAGEVFPKNLSALLNLGSLLERGYRPAAAEEQLVRSRLRVRLNDLRNLDEARWELSAGGRLFVEPKVREQLAKLREELRRRVDESPSRQILETAVGEMQRLSEMTGEAKEKELARMETTTIASLKSSQVAPWAKNLLLGDFALQKGDDESVKEGRKAYQSVIMEGKGEYRMAFGRLLDLDWARKDRAGLEYDALLVLRKDIRYAQASAILGMIRLEKGEYESAERFLRRALKAEDGPQSAVKNDLALALSGLGRHDEAEKLIREAVAEVPKNWNFHDSLAHILRAAGKEDEADAAQRTARDLARDQNEMRAYRALNQAADKKTSSAEPKDGRKQ